MCISLVIPASYSSWINCKVQIEKMICNSIEYPKEVIIVISGGKKDYNTKYLTYCKYNLTLYFKKNRRNSASNKNFGFKHTTCDYISFFDSDDVMFSNRVSILHYLINHYPKYDIIMHMFTRNSILKMNFNISYYLLDKYFYLNSSYITELYRNKATNTNIKQWGCCNFLPLQLPVANGWITVKRNLFDKEKFNECNLFRRSEDSEYNGRVILKGYNSLVLKIILGYYSKRNTCNYFTNT